MDQCIFHDTDKLFLSLDENAVNSAQLMKLKLASSHRESRKKNRKGTMILLK